MPCGCPDPHLRVHAVDGRGAVPSLGTITTARNVMGLLSNLIVVLLFAWVVRALLGARQVTWGRLVAAALLGMAVGAAAAGLLVIDVTAPIEGQLAADRKSTRLNSSHSGESRMPSSA